MKEKVNIVDNGNNISYNFISLFQINDNDILLMTNNEVDEKGNTKIISTRIYNNDTLMRIDDNLWTNVKTAMKSIVANNSEGYTYLKLNKEIKYQTTDNWLRTIGLSSNELNTMIKSYNEYNNEDEEIPIPVLQNIDRSEMDDEEILEMEPKEEVEKLEVTPTVESNEQPTERLDVVPQEDNTETNEVIEEKINDTGGVEVPSIESVVASLNEQ